MTDKRSMDDFWSAADVWINKPHVINKRLSGVTETKYRDVDTSGLNQALSTLLGSSIEISHIFQFLGVDNANKELGTAGRWCVGVRTIIPKVTKTAECNVMYKEVVIKGEKQPETMRIYELFRLLYNYSLF